MLELTTLAALRQATQKWRAQRDSIALVPTMGALHVGHLALVRAAQAEARRVVVSIFVNPTQFGPNEDFDRYPRPRARDLELLHSVGADGVWLPTAGEMYPTGCSTHVKAGSAAEGLDGAYRPGHFDGVATVVTKLLMQVAPDVALFGEKDYQQLCVIKQLVRDLNLPVRIEGVATVREADGLALSSRNQYLSEAERKLAPVLYQTLCELAHTLALRREGALIEHAKNKLLAGGFRSIDYLELCAEDTLAPLTAATQPARLLAAAWLGTTRLIDNVPVEQVSNGS